jgi:ribonucleoside-diphosphate reductase alpha subunit
MKVLKRNSQYEDMKFDKVTSRINNLMYGLSKDVVAEKVVQNIVSSMYDGIPTREVDSLSAEISISMITDNPDYEILASRIVASNIQKIAPRTLSDAISILYENNIVTKDLWDFVVDNKELLNKTICPKLDNELGFFGLKTLEKSYLQRVDGNITETPQYMFMRVAACIHCGDLIKTVETYKMMSKGLFIHATPTLFNAGTPRPQLSSCFLLAMKDDSIDGIYDTLKDCAQISKWAGGIGLHIHNVRSNKSRIRGTNGVSDGIVPMLRVFNSTARYVNQAGRRKGSFAIYVEPWHADIMEFLELRLNQGDEEARTRDLFTALWIPDLFMERVRDNGDWCLMCPDECPGLSDVYGDDFKKLYTQYEEQGKFRTRVKASVIWKSIIRSQIETGTPYMLYKDACNKKSNQKNLGVIKSSNLCTEILEYTDKDETAVCNLASLALPKFIENGEFNWKNLHKVTRVVTRNLNMVIDKTFYPIPEAKKSNLRHRPIGLGVQGLADVFIMLGMAFDSPEARIINTRIFETMYHAALEESCEIAREFGPYETFEGSPASQGILQHDMWEEGELTWNWTTLKKNIKKHGLRNSLVMAPMPTASTSQILGNNECIEPYTTNIYLRRTLAGEFVVVNKHLVKYLQSRGLWSREVKNKIVAANGSVQNLTEVEEHIKPIFKTVWEIKQRDIIDMAADRGRFIDQSQSLNLFIEQPTLAKLSSMHLYSWKKGLKTGMYYLRTKAKAKAIQVTIDPNQCTSCSA